MDLRCHKCHPSHVSNAIQYPLYIVSITFTVISYRVRALITAHLPAIGVLLGVGHVVVLYRHQMLTKHSYILDLSEILTQWTDELACAEQRLQQGFSDMEIRSLKSFLRNIVNTSTTPAPLPVSEGVPDRSILQTALTYRRKGLWKAVEEAPFDVIGLSYVKGFAQRSQAVLALSQRSIATTPVNDGPTSERPNSFSGIFSSLSSIAVPNATADEEDIIAHYASLWKDTWTESKSFRCDDLQVALRSISALFYAFLHAEYAMGGKYFVRFFLILLIHLFFPAYILTKDGQWSLDMTP